MTLALDPLIPYPPRHWWLKRMTLALLVLLACLLVLRLWWGGRTRALLAAEHARLRAAGLPVTGADLDAPALPPEENAVTFIRQALSVHKAGLGPSDSGVAFPEYPPFPAQWHTLADAAVAANGPVFPPLRRARAHDGVDWQMQLRSPMYRTTLPNVNRTRGLANLGFDAAMREHVRGNDAAALELMRDVRRLAVATDRQPFLISHLVAVFCDLQALNRLQAMAPALEVTEGDDIPVGSPVPNGPATRGQVKAMIAELAGPKAKRTSFAYGLATERVAQADALRWGTARNWALKPLFDVEQRRLLDDTDWYAKAAAQQSFSGLSAVLASRKPEPAGAVPISALMSRTLKYSMDNRFEDDLRVEADRRMTAVSLAVRLYRVDHGTWPASLDELVPAYIPAIPADPFSPAGGPLRYVLVEGGLPNAADRPLVYSVDRDGTDETASGERAPPRTPQYKHRPNDVDQRRDLARWAPVPDNGAGDSHYDAHDSDHIARRGGGGDSPQAVDDEPDVANDPRDGE